MEPRFDAGRAEQAPEPRIAACPREVEAGGLGPQEAVVDDELLALPESVADPGATKIDETAPHPLLARRRRVSPVPLDDEGELVEVVEVHEDAGELDARR